MLAIIVAFLALVLLVPPQPHYAVTINLPTTAAALQDYRSLFSLVRGGQTICSAGFARYGQTRQASSTQMLELYCQPVGVTEVSLGRPSDHLEQWEARRMFPGEKNPDWPWPYYEQMSAISAALRDDPRTAANPKWSLAAFWAQRIHSLVVSEIGLAIGKGNFTGWGYDPERDIFADPDALADYGEVVTLVEPHSLLHELALDGPKTTLTFSITPTRLSISQDGKMIASKAVDIDLPEGLTPVMGCGPFGPSDIDGAKSCP